MSSLSHLPSTEQGPNQGLPRSSPGSSNCCLEAAAGSVLPSSVPPLEPRSFPTPLLSRGCSESPIIGRRVLGCAMLDCHCDLDL